MKLRAGATRTQDRGAVAAVQTLGETLRVVVLGAGEGGPPRLVEAANVPAVDSTGLARLFERTGVGRVVRVAPAKETLCRSVSLPLPPSSSDGDATALAALRLLAEAELPAGIPPHRRAGGLVGLTEADGSRHGLLTAWMGASVGPLSETPEHWTTVPGALAALWAGKGRVAVYADPREAAVVVIAAGAGRLAARVTRAEATGDFGSESLAAVVEACELAGSAAPASIRRGLTLDASAHAALRSRVSGLREEPEWLDEFGVALGAALLALDPHPAAGALAEMTDAAAQPRLSPVARVGAWLASPRVAWLTVAAAVVLLVCGPLAMAWGRASILRSRTAEVEKKSGSREELEKRAALYRQLEQSRWPMAKLLTDVSCAAPVGITLQNLRLAPGQGLTVHGTARSQELVTQFQAALNKTKVFGKASVTRTEFKEAGVDFDLVAEVANPFANVQNAEDFAAKPLAVRLYGEGASNDSVEDRPVRQPRTRRGDRGAGGNDPARTPDPASGDRRPPGTSNDAVPPPVSDEEIAKMDRAAAIKGWTTRKSYVQKHPTLDASTKQRLADEEQKMRARADALKGGA